MTAEFIALLALIFLAGYGGISLFEDVREARRDR
jgi:hypothetical protein